MITHAVRAAAVVAVGCRSPRPVDQADAVLAIRQRFADWVNAERRRDLDAAVSFLAPDAVIQAEGAPAVNGRDAARAVWKGIFELPYTDIHDIEPRTAVIAQSGELAYDLGNWKVVLPGQDGSTEERGQSAIVWVKRAGTWMAAAIAFSMDAPAAPPVVQPESP
jgi:ketosteroid isomerase-like protein